MSIPSDYLERAYAGFIGKTVGIRLGAPVEPAIRTYERIREVYGDITGYVKPYRNFATDDDANGPVYFIDGNRLLSARDSRHRRGMIGCGCLCAARALYGPFKVGES